ncbi:MAG: hypothetical protein Q7S05_00310 [bacterium]|nr:hypothetical protein [bacterium]
MLENFKKPVERKSLAPEKVEVPATMNHGEELLSAIEEINSGLDKAVAERFGKGFYDTACARINAWYEKLSQKAKDLIPESKSGRLVSSGAILILPGGIILVPLTIALLRWSMRENKADTNSSTEI